MYAIYLGQNIVEMLITITVFVSVICHRVTLSIYKYLYLLLLPIPYFLALWQASWLELFLG